MTKVSRFERLALSVLVLVVSFAIAVNRTLENILPQSSWSIWFRWAISVLSSAAALKFAVRAMYYLIERFGFLTRLYWGAEMYWKGYWHYTSELDGNKYLGVWRFEQTGTEIRLSAFGLNEDFERRFISYSIGEITRLANSSDIYQVIMSRSDFEENEPLMYTMSRFAPDRPIGRYPLFRSPEIMHGDTFTIGGIFSGQVNRNVVVVRHKNIHSDAEMVEELRRINPLGWNTVAA